MRSSDLPGVLIVEDDALVVRDLALHVESLGYKVAGTASSGDAALASAVDCGAGIVLMDIKMSGSKDGVEAAIEIRETLGIPVVFVSAYSDQAVMERVRAAGPYGFVVKPFQERDIRLALQTALYRHASEKAHTRSQEARIVARFAGHIANDLNNNLTGIKGRLDLLRERDGIDELVAGELDVIAQGVGRVTELAAQLLALSSQRRGAVEAVRLKPLLSALTYPCSTSLTSTSEGGESISVSTDPVLLGRAIVALVANACESGGSGVPVDISWRVPTPQDVSKAGLPVRAEQFVVVSVIDGGRGMSEEVVARAREPLFSTKEGHAGLGLTSVQGFARQFNGHLVIDTVPGSGTTASLWLPRAAGPTQAESGTTKSHDRVGGSILVVDDHEDVRRLTGKALELAGFEVRVARSGDEAIGILESDPQSVDLLLTDVMMPGMTGPQLVARATRIRRDLKILYMSGFVDPVESGKPEVVPQHLLITKPFAISELTARIAQSLRDEHPGSGAAEP